MASPTCDCGNTKVSTSRGFLMCEHCDTGACGGNCKLDREYKTNVSRRLEK